MDETELGIHFEALPANANLLADAQKTDQKHTYYSYTSRDKVAYDKRSGYYVDVYFVNITDDQYGDRARR